jgi:acetyl-CoA acyltransferase
MRNVYVAGVAMTRFFKQPERSVKDLAREAILGALLDAGMERAQVEVAYFSNAVAGSITGQEMVVGQVSLRAIGMDRIPIVNVENACASASSAFHLAWQAVAGGFVDVALAIGAEKMSHPDKAVSFRSIGGAVDVETNLNSAAGSRSPLMDVYAAEARDYMKTSGATIQDFAAVAVKNQHNGSLNPLSQYGSELTLEEVMSAREVVWPLTLYMCSPISDGAAAAILVSSKRTHDARRPIRVAGSAMASGIDPAGGVKSATVAANKAYDMASVGPKDVDCAEVHDAAASAELLLYEQLGFARPGDGAVLVREGITRLDGRLPVNTSGGLLSRGHPIGATGLGQLYETVIQLRSEAGERQVQGARIALAQNGGGYMAGDNLANVVNILIRD